MSNDKRQKKEEQPIATTFKEKTLAFLKETGIVLGLFLLINNFVIASFLVPTGSMENEVLTGELLFVNKFIYGGTSPRIFHSPMCVCHGFVFRHSEMSSAEM